MIYRWGNNPRRAELKGRECRIVARGSMGTVLVEFLDTGEKVTTSWRAVTQATALQRSLPASDSDRLPVVGSDKT